MRDTVACACSRGRNHEEVGAAPLHELLVWLDVETTGLDYDNDRVLEIAMVVTDRQLHELDSVAYVVHHTAATLTTMSKFATTTHSKSYSRSEQPLVQACADPLVALPESDIDRRLSDFLRRFVTSGDPKDRLMMAGSTVYFDKMFMRKWFPATHDMFHYRLMDVSTMLEAVKRWKPELVAGQPRSTVEHRAMADARSSLSLMRYYKGAILDPEEAQPTQNRSPPRAVAAHPKGKPRRQARRSRSRPSSASGSATTSPQSSPNKAPWLAAVERTVEVRT